MNIYTDLQWLVPTVQRRAGLKLSVKLNLSDYSGIRNIIK